MKRYIPDKMILKSIGIFYLFIQIKKDLRVLLSKTQYKNKTRLQTNVNYYQNIDCQFEYKCWFKKTHQDCLLFKFSTNAMEQNRNRVITIKIIKNPQNKQSQPWNVRAFVQCLENIKSRYQIKFGQGENQSIKQSQ